MVIKKLLFVLLFFLQFEPHLVQIISFYNYNTKKHFFIFISRQPFKEYKEYKKQRIKQVKEETKKNLDKIKNQKKISKKKGKHKKNTYIQNTKMT